MMLRLVVSLFVLLAAVSTISAMSSYDLVDFPAVYVVPSDLLYGYFLLQYYYCYYYYYFNLLGSLGSVPSLQ